MKLYRKDNVLEAARKRVRYIFEEFPNQVSCNVSGGKDSTVVFHLCLEAAHELGQLPLKVSFLDQEAEWEATIDIMRQMMYRDDVQPYWYQIPFDLQNATSATESWLRAWDEEKQDVWMRPKEDAAYKENIFNTRRFHGLFAPCLAHQHPEGRGCNIGGLRAEEAPNRQMMLTAREAYHGITWGNGQKSKEYGPQDGEYYVFYPIYDWNTTDVWKYIHDEELPYNRVYDYQYGYGVGIKQMRVSSLHHEQAVGTLFYLQECEPKTWEKLTQRVEGVDMAGKMIDDAFTGNRKLPYMFRDWMEYRDFLLPRLIPNEEWRKSFRKLFDRHDKLFVPHQPEYTLKMHVGLILTNDYDSNFARQWEIGMRQYLKDHGIVNV